jgi:flagellar hook assembly protein FlgD
MPSDVGSLSKAGELQTQYLTLLVTQLRNQNPLEPMDNNDMTSQLAQISQLEQLEAANAKFDRLLAAAEARHGAALIGQDVAFLPQEGEAPVVGTVTGFDRTGDEPLVLVGPARVPLDDILAVYATNQQVALKENPDE